MTAGSTTAEAQFFALRVEIDRSGADGGRREAREWRGVPGIHGVGVHERWTRYTDDNEKKFSLALTAFSLSAEKIRREFTTQIIFLIGREKDSAASRCIHIYIYIASLNRRSSYLLFFLQGLENLFLFHFGIMCYGLYIYQ